ncbi:tRNA(His) guanylyltransferase Thg1 family protein [Gemmata sp. JC673]|uniref:tRNA(His) guanylyltransferase Thg1 family protein n=1 Tax=Gemmata algarum TaxID=2975278 RepID=A0ABU5F3Q8_9BACT|nr:tRNA(His) guanylyltransferase Thg1 family protein [Gemmata algarum]MDY3562207.1 tRNA(His) guanylyltransferase Thg1 family protein [Gemmata algarum]
MAGGLAERMKLYEGAESGRRLMPRLPALARLDGRAFHSFVRGLARPFDQRLSALMIDTLGFLVRETNATVGYTQSDEITLAWVPLGADAQVFFDGRVQKMTSALAALCSVHFCRRLPAFLPADGTDRFPTFDCRVWNVPTLDEAANVFVWRELDAKKNSISMAARAYYDHAAVHGRTGAELQELLFQKGVNWNNYPAFFKRGTYSRRCVVRRPFTADERNVLPVKHQGRNNPDLMIERSEVAVFNLPPLPKLENGAGVLFRDEEPVLKKGTAAVPQNALGERSVHGTTRRAGEQADDRCE